MLAVCHFWRLLAKKKSDETFLRLRVAFGRFEDGKSKRHQMALGLFQGILCPASFRLLALGLDLRPGHLRFERTAAFIPFRSSP